MDALILALCTVHYQWVSHGRPIPRPPPPSSPHPFASSVPRWFETSSLWCIRPTALWSLKHKKTHLKELWGWFCFIHPGEHLIFTALLCLTFICLIDLSPGKYKQNKLYLLSVSSTFLYHSLISQRLDGHSNYINLKMILIHLLELIIIYIIILLYGNVWDQEKVSINKKCTGQIIQNRMAGATGWIKKFGALSCTKKTNWLNQYEGMNMHIFMKKKRVGTNHWTREKEVSLKQITHQFVMHYSWFNFQMEPPFYWSPSWQKDSSSSNSFEKWGFSLSCQDLVPKINILMFIRRKVWEQFVVLQ